MTRVKFTSTEQKLWKRMPEAMHLQTASEMLRMWHGRQVVPGASSSDKKSSIDSCLRRTGSDVVNADCRQILILRSAGWRSSSARYIGAFPWIHLSFTGSIGVLWDSTKNSLEFHKVIHNWYHLLVLWQKPYRNWKQRFFVRTVENQKHSIFGAT